MKIRRSKITDAAALARLHRGTVRHVNSKDYPAKLIVFWASRIKANHFKKTHERWKRFVALVGKKIIGFGDVNRADGFGGLYVHKDFIGKGVGTALLKKMEITAKKLGLGSFRFDSSITARPFYEKHGYKTVRKKFHKMGTMRMLAYEMYKNL